MWASTKPMKTTPEAAISSFSVIVERDALAPWTSGVVSMPCSAARGAGLVVATGSDATPALGCPPSHRRGDGM